MDITLYKMSTETNRVDKTNYLSNAISLTNVILRSGTSVISPTLELQYDDRLFSYNYVYITQFNRYYFINDIESFRNDLIILSLSVDVLHTYKNIIKDNYCFVARNENDYNVLIDDDIKQLKAIKETSYEAITNITTVDTFSVEPSDRTIVMSVASTLGGNRFVPASAYVDTQAIGIIESGCAVGTLYYALQYSEAIKFATSRKIFESTENRSYIKRITAYPFALTDVSFYRQYEESGQTYDLRYLIPLGVDANNYVDMGQEQTLMYPNKCLIVKKIADFNFTRQNVTFLDYEPYTTYELYLPFVNFIQFKLKDILGKHLQVYYTSSIDDAQSTVIVLNKTDNKILYKNTCQLGVDIGLTASNIEANRREKTAIAWQMGVGVVSSAVLAAVGGFSGNPLAVGMGASGIATNLTKGITEWNKIMDTADVGTYSGIDGLTAPRVCFWRIVRNIPLNDYMSTNFNKTYGRPLLAYRKLENVTGYTQVSQIHLEGFSEATKNEIDDIEYKLKSGVIM